MNQDTRALRRRPSLLRGGRVACFLLLFTLAAVAAEPMIITSASKQFIVRGRPQTSAFASHPNSEVVYINPALLAVTCDRVKQTVAKELGWGDRWHGTIFINVHPVKFDNEQPELRPFRTTEGWRYRLELPDEVQRRRLLESIVEALLTEFADRAQKDFSVEL